MQLPKIHIDLPFSIESLSALLRDGALDGRQNSHYQIADWCCRMSNKFQDEDCSNAFDHALSIAADVDCQWELYLANSYSITELQKIDFDTVSLPTDWFSSWVLQLNKQS